MGTQRTWLSPPTFCADTAHSIDQISRISPGATVLVRIAHSGTGSAITLSGRFGCPPDQAAELALHAADRGLDVAGLAWHLGCQQRDRAQWHTATATAAHDHPRTRPRTRR